MQIFILGFYFQGIEKEQKERSLRLDELNQTGQILLEQMGKGETIDFLKNAFLGGGTEYYLQFDKSNIHILTL